MPEAVIVSALRTPIGTAVKGTLRDTDAYQLADHIVGAMVTELDSHVDRADIDDLILGEGLYGGGVAARWANVHAGMAHIPGAAVNRHCAASLTAVQLAAGDIRAGMSDAVVPVDPDCQPTN